MTIWLASSAPCFPIRIYFLVFVFYIISTSNGSEYNKDIQELNRQSEESLAARKRTSSATHHQNKVFHNGNRKSVSLSGNENSPALKAFLENVLKAQNELKWIDEAVRKAQLKKAHSEKSSKYKSTYSSRSAAVGTGRIEETRDKRGGPNTNRNMDILPAHRKRKYKSDDFHNIPERIYSDKEMKFKRHVNNNNFKYGNGIHSFRSIDKPINEELDVSKKVSGNRDHYKSTEKTSKNESAERWSRDYGTVRKELKNSDHSEIKGEGSGNIDSRARDLDDSLIRHESSQIIDSVPSGKSRTMKETNMDELPLSLETLKHTVLELSKSLIEPNKGTNGNFDVTNISSPEEYERQVEKDLRKKEGHVKSKHERHIPWRVLKNSKNSHDTYSGNGNKRWNWWDVPKLPAEAFNYELKDNDLEERSDLDNKIDNIVNERENFELDKVKERVKREEKDKVNEGNLKLFYRAGFGELYPEIVRSEKGPIGKSLESQYKNVKSGSLDVNKTSLSSYFNVPHDSLNGSQNIGLKDLWNAKELNFKGNANAVYNKTINLSNSADKNNKDSELKFLLGAHNIKTSRKLLSTKKNKEYQKNSSGKRRNSVYNKNFGLKSAPSDDYYKFKGYKKRDTEDVLRNYGMMKILQRRKERGILQEADSMVNSGKRELNKDHSKFYKRAIKIDKLEQPFERSKRKRRDENLQQIHQNEELGNLYPLKNENSDAAGEEYDDQGMEDIIQNYNDKEELEDQDQENEYEKSDRSKVLVNRGQDLNKDDKFVKKRHVPIIQYFDYEENPNYENIDFPVFSNMQMNKKDTVARIFGDGPQKKNMQKEEEDKLDMEKKKSKNKTPKQEFFGDVVAPEISKNQTSKELPNAEKFLTKDKIWSIIKRKGYEDKDNLSDRDYGRSVVDSNIWSDQSSKSHKVLKALNEDDEDPGRNIFSEPLEYNLNVRGKLKADAIGAFLGNDLPLEEHLFAQDKDMLSFGNNDQDYEPQKLEYNDMDQDNDLKSTYEKLEKVNEWRGEVRKRPRLKGDEKFSHYPEELLDTMGTRLNKYSKVSPQKTWYLREHNSAGETDLESTTSKSNESDQYSSEQNFMTESQDKFLNEQPQTIHRDFSRFSNIDDSNSSSGSSYSALKITDDMFKGGIEQSNPTEEKPSEPLDYSQTTTEWKVTKSSDSNSDSVSTEINENQSPRNHLRQPVAQADFLFQHERIDSLEEIASEKNKNFNREKRSNLNSEDLMHESFVEPFDWMNDFDDELKVKIGRGLKSFENQIKTRYNNKNYSSSELAQVCSVKSIFEHNSTDKYFEKVNLTNLVMEPNKDKTQNSRDKFIFEITTKHSLVRVTEENLVKNATSTAFYTTKKPFDDLVQSLKNSTIASHEKIENNQTMTFPIHEEQPKIERMLRLRRKADFFGNQLNDVDSQYSVQNDFSNNNFRNKKWYEAGRIMKDDQRRLKSNVATLNYLKNIYPIKHYFNEFDKAEVGKYKHRNRRHKKKHILNLGSENEKYWHPVRSFQEKHFRNPSYGLSNRYENLKEQNVELPGNNFEKGKLENLFKADDIEDDSQLNLAYHGELAGKIVEKIFEEVQRSEALKTALGPGLVRKQMPKKPDQASPDQEHVKHTEEIKKITELIDNIVHEEVKRKTCISLSPDMREFLQWMLEDELDQTPSDKDSPLPTLNGQEHYITLENFLFHNETNDADLKELYKKVYLLKNLISEYNTMTEKEKAKVYSVHDYLVKKLDSLVEYIDSKISEEANYRYSFHNKADLQNSMMHRFQKRDIQSVHQKPHHHTKHKKRKRKHQKRKKHKHKPSGSTSREYRKKKYEIQHLRRKRANMDDEDWDAYNSGYEEPAIHSLGISDPEKHDYLFWKDRKKFTDGNYENRRITEIDKTIDRKNHGIRKKSNKIKKKINEDLLPIKRKNEAEDEMFLLNSRKAWKRKNEQQLEEVAFGKDMRGNGKEKERFEKLEKNRYTNEETPAREKREENKDRTCHCSQPEMTENKGRISGSITSKNKNEEFNKKEDLLNSNGLLAMELKFIEILPSNSKCSKYKCKKEHVADENEVLKLEKKTNVYPDTTESLIKDCFTDKVEVLSTTHQSFQKHDEINSVIFENLNNSNESNSKFAETSFNKIGYKINGSSLQSKTTEQSKPKIINFDEVEKQLKNIESINSEKNSTVSQNIMKENQIKQDYQDDEVISKFDALILDKNDKDKHFKNKDKSDFPIFNKNNFEKIANIVQYLKSPKNNNDFDNLNSNNVKNDINYIHYNPRTQRLRKRHKNSTELQPRIIENYRKKITRN